MVKPDYRCGMGGPHLGAFQVISEIEQVIGGSEADFRQAALEEIIAMQQDTPSHCPLGGGQMENKGKRSKQAIRRRGETTIERTYYQCQQCGHGYFRPR